VIEATWRHQIGPCALEAWGAKWVAVRCPRELASKMRAAGGLWEPGSRRLIERRRIGPVIRALERDTDSLFRHARLSLDA
jgi:hypothetical protein